MRISSFLSQSSNKEMATGKMHIIPPWMFCYAVIRLYLEKLQQIEHDRRWKAEEIHMLDMCRNVLLDVELLLLSSFDLPHLSWTSKFLLL